MNASPEKISTSGLKAFKGLGQHFLLDMNITRKIVRLAGDLSNQTIIEIGSGPAGLTRALLESSATHIIAIEKDKRFAEALQPLATSSKGRLQIIEGDALNIDPATLGSAPRSIIANLPYNVGTLLFTNWLQNASAYQQLILMFQKEVAERIIAKQGDKAYGRLSILAQFCGKAEIIMRVPASVFTPPPKVDSAIVRFIPHHTPHNLPLKVLEKITAKAFGQRRKMLRAIFKDILSEDDFAALHIDPKARAENLSLDDFIRLAAKI